MDLSQEDSLRLNVMLRQKLRAIRLNESDMSVSALSDRGEAKVSLNPTCNNEKYLRWVKELLSTFVLGTPGGYPVYLKRWTRMGQMRDESLQGLLLLGEPEAVVAVAHAPGLTEVMARDAWWIMPSAEVARKMLESPEVAKSEFAPELAAFLVEFLPFEEDQQAIVDTVKLILQPGLVSTETQLSLWRRGVRKSAIYVGFLAAIPDQLPELPPQKQFSQQSGESLELDQILDSSAPNWYSSQLRRCFSVEGQTFLSTVASTISKLNSPEVAIALFEAIKDYYRGHPWNDSTEVRTIAELELLVESHMQQTNTEWQTLGKGHEPRIKAILSLAIVSEHLLNPIFAQTDAVGSVMRKKMRHVTDHILLSIKTLTF